MHTKILQAWKSLLPPQSGRALEVGAMPQPDTLLALPQFAACERIGLNLLGPVSYDGIEILAGNANAIDFPDASFDVVVSNATLEHDPHFWLSISEMRRVLKPGGWMAIGVPGYLAHPVERYVSRATRKLLGRFAINHLGALTSGTITFRVHNTPGDYYRFSEQTVQQVFFEGFENVQVISALVPPRLIGTGRKAASA